ncbi:hypothetical protein RAS1_18710 [Phycisphaerae bacterium RAS1]|nr:hypothetical protein RAS1_18710 [Phycisphaerae bacterium RAS1]
MDDAAVLTDRVELLPVYDFSEPTESDPARYEPAAAPEPAPLRLVTPDEHPIDSEPAAPAAAAADAPSARQIIEAMLFSSDAPLSAARLADFLDGTPVRVVHGLIDELNATYAASGLSFRIQEIAGGYRMLTLPDFQPWVARLNKHRSQTRLTGAALEALSIVAYKQPIIRAEVEAIRGVACGEVLNRLREMGLVKIAGRAEIVGRPLLYATTRKFLDLFGLADLNDLPPMEALTLKRAPAVAPPLPMTPATDNAAVETQPAARAAAVS